MAIASIKKSSTPQSELWDLLLSTPEIVNTYTWNSINPNSTLGYLPYLHWYQAGRGHVSVSIDGTPYPAIEVLRKVGVRPLVNAETVNASTQDWCNKVRIDTEVEQPGVFKIDWEEHIIPIYAPCGLIVGKLSIEGKYTKHNRKTEPTFTLGEDYTISMLSLPPGYQWEIWRRRKRKKETWMQKGNADWAIERFGHFVLYDRLESGSTSYDPGLSSGTIKFSIYNSQTGARSYLSNIGISYYVRKKKVFYV